MYTHLAEQIEEVRRRIDEPTVNKISNNYIIRALNDGSVKISRELYLQTDDVTAFSSIAAQQGYVLPSDFIAVTEVIWQYDVAHYPLARLERKTFLQSLPQQGDPAFYTIDEARKLILVSPIPSGSAITTTLNGGIGVSDVTINVVSTTGFGGLGYITIGTEIIQYSGVTSTSFTGCIRGAGNTVAAAYSTGATVTWDDIVLYYTRLPKQAKNIITTSKVTVTNGSTAVGGDGTVQWVSGQNIYPNQYLGIGALSTNTSNETFPLTWYKIASIGTPTSLVLSTPYAETTIATATACIINDMSEIYEQDCSILITWATYLCEKILGNEAKAENARLAFNAEMALAEERINGPDNLYVTARTRFANNVAGQIIRSPSHYEKFNF